MTFKVLDRIIDLGGRTNDSILVVGTGRSGTTWVGDVIAHLTSSRVIFETLILDDDNEIGALKTSGWPSGNFTSRTPYLRADAGRDSTFFAPLESVLSGRIVNEFCDHITPPGFYTRRVIKEIRANLLLDYVATTWPEVKVVWVMRDVLPVINSQLFAFRKHRWGFDLDTEYLLGQRDLVEDWLAPHAQAMRAASTQAERLAHRWCIETMIPSRQGIHRRANVVRVRYEDLIGDIDAWEPIWRLISPGRWRKEDLIPVMAKPAFTRFDGFDPSKLDQLSTTEIAAIRRVVEQYELEPLA